MSRLIYNAMCRRISSDRDATWWREPMRPRSSAPQTAKRTPARAWIGSVEANFACLGREQTADSVDDGALARTVGAEQRHAFPGGNRERHAPDHLVVAIGDFEIADLKQHCRRSRGRRRRQRARFAPAPARRKRWVAPRAAPGCDRPSA